MAMYTYSTANSWVKDGGTGTVKTIISRASPDVALAINGGSGIDAALDLTGLQRTLRANQIQTS